MVQIMELPSDIFNFGDSEKPDNRRRARTQELKNPKKLVFRDFRGVAQNQNPNFKK